MIGRNTLCRALEECIGTEAAVSFSTTYGSRTRNTYIPKTMGSEKAKRIASSIGFAAAEKLVLSKDFGGRALRVPTLNLFLQEVRDDFIRIQVKNGVESKEIAAELGITVDRVRQIRRWVVGPRDRYPQRLRISIPTARTAAIYRAVLPTSLATVYSPANMTAEVVREALGYFALFGPSETKRNVRRSARPSAKTPGPPRHPLDVWNR